MIAIEDPGLLTTVQDLGRIGHGAIGVATSGAADPLALLLANRLLGNSDNDAALETTLNGCAIRAHADTRIAIAGAACNATIRGSSGERLAPVLRALPLRAGDTLTISPAQRGVRTYIALAGGVQTPMVLGSRSTHATSGFGSPHDRPLRTGDELPLCVGRTRAVTGERDALLDIARAALVSRLRVVPGIHAEITAPITRTVGRASDRVGVRLEGPAIDLKTPAQIPSEAMHHGAIQRTPDGTLVALGPDGAPTGGYPVVASVALVDLPVLGQLRPGEAVQLVPVIIEGAIRALHEREKLLDRALRVRHDGDA